MAEQSLTGIGPQAVPQIALRGNEERSSGNSGGSGLGGAVALTSLGALSGGTYGVLSPKVPTSEAVLAGGDWLDLQGAKTTDEQQKILDDLKEAPKKLQQQVDAEVSKYFIPGEGGAVPEEIDASKLLDGKTPEQYDEAIKALEKDPEGLANKLQEAKNALGKDPNNIELRNAYNLAEENLKAHTEEIARRKSLLDCVKKLSPNGEKIKLTDFRKFWEEKFKPGILKTIGEELSKVPQFLKKVLTAEHIGKYAAIGAAIGGALGLGYLLLSSGKSSQA